MNFESYEYDDEERALGGYMGHSLGNGKKRRGRTKMEDVCRSTSKDLDTA